MRDPAPLAVSHGASGRRSSSGRWRSGVPLRAARAHARAQDRNPVPGWRQACFYGGFVVIAARSPRSARQPGTAVRAHDRAPAARRRRRAADRARPDRAADRADPADPALRPPARARPPADRVPAVGGQPLRLAPAGPLPSGAAPRRRACARARDVPRLRHQHVDVPVRAAADAELVRQPRQARLHHRRAPRGHRARQHLPVVGHRLLPLLHPRRGLPTTSRRSPTRTSPARS